MTDQVKVTPRMSTKGWVNHQETNIDLDSCAEVDYISHEFAKRLQLQ